VTLHFLLPWNLLPWLMAVVWACMLILIFTVGGGL